MRKIVNQIPWTFLVVCLVGAAVVAHEIQNGVGIDIQDGVAGQVAGGVGTGDTPTWTGNHTWTNANLDIFLCDTNVLRLLSISRKDSEFDAMLYVDMVAGSNSETAVKILVTDNGHGSVGALEIEYTSEINTNEFQTAIFISLDESGAGGGEFRGIEIAALGGTAVSVHALNVGVNIDPLHHQSGGFSVNDTAYLTNLVVGVSRTNVTTEFNSDTDANNKFIFTSDNDSIVLGENIVFDAIAVTLATNASGGGIGPTFEYSTNTGWVAFNPVDGTEGMRHSGIITWDSEDLIPEWTTNLVDGEFGIRITRTRNSLGTTPQEKLVQANAGVVEYEWKANGELHIKEVYVDASPTGTLQLATKAYADGVTNITIFSSFGTTDTLPTNGINQPLFSSAFRKQATLISFQAKTETLDGVVLNIVRQINTNNIQTYDVVLGGIIVSNVYTNITVGFDMTILSNNTLLGIVVTNCDNGTTNLWFSLDYNENL